MQNIMLTFGVNLWAVLVNLTGPEDIGNSIESHAYMVAGWIGFDGRRSGVL